MTIYVTSENGSPVQGVPERRKIVPEEERRLISAFKVPEFIPAYSARQNRHVTAARVDTYHWLLQHRIDTLFDPKSYEGFVLADFPGLTGRVYFDAAPEGLDWACKFVAWFFVVDDQVDDTVVGMSPESSLPLFLELNLLFLWSFPDDPVLYRNLMVIIDKSCPSVEIRTATLEFIHAELSKARSFPNTVYYKKLGPAASTLQDLWETSISTMSKTFCLRFARCTQLYFIGSLEESKNRKNNTVLSLAEYITNRRRTAGVEPTLVIIDLVYKEVMPEHLLSSTPLKEMFDATVDVVGWHNDIWSFKKEVSKGDAHNLVFVISHEQKCSYDEAGLLAHQMLERRILDLEKAATDFAAMASPPNQEVVSIYIKVCQYWVTSSHDWHVNTSRYV